MVHRPPEKTTGPCFEGLCQKRRSAFHSIVSFAVLAVALGASIAHAAGPNRAPKGFSPAYELPTTPPIVLPDPLLSSFGFDRYATPSFEKPPNDATFTRGKYGARAGQWAPVYSITLRSSDSLNNNATENSDPNLPNREVNTWFTQTIEELSDQYLENRANIVPYPADYLPSSREPKIPWCRRRPTNVARYGAESDTFMLVGCDGQIAPETIEKLSILFRPPEIAKPVLPLPDEPDSENQGEWVTGIKLIHPRLVWAMQQLATAFPWKQIYIMSGYRRGSHEGLHGQGRAIDLFVLNVPNEKVYKLCRELNDFGCGYYPNNRFVHIDVRKPGTGHAYWIDISGPGEPSEYVDSWPGVEEGGAKIWSREH